MSECGCKCPTVPPYLTPTDRVLCLGFTIANVPGTADSVVDGTYSGTWLQGYYGGRVDNPLGAQFRVDFIVAPSYTRVRVTIVDYAFTRLAEYEYTDVSSTLRIPFTSAMLPQTLTKTFGSIDWPSTISLVAQACPSAPPMNCCSVCDPLPCAYEMNLGCLKGPLCRNVSGDYRCYGVFTIDPDSQHYINQRVVFRQCDKPSCIYTALGPTRTGNPIDRGDGFCDDVIGLDWTGLGCTISQGKNANCEPEAYGNKLPCRWSDFSLCSQDYLPALSWSCATADMFEKWIELNILTGTIRSTGFFAANNLPPFPDFDLIGGVWDCYGCNVFQILPNQVNHWEIPDRIEVRAIVENATGRCTTRQTFDNTGTDPVLDVTGFCTPPGAILVTPAPPLLGYDTKSNRCNCCDPGCVCVGMWATLQDVSTSSAFWQRRSDQACQPPIRAPQGTAVGPGRQADFEFTISATAVPVSVVIYCDGTPAPNGWYADFWLNNAFFETKQMSACCCPFGLGVTSSELLPDYPGFNIQVAVGEGCGGIHPPVCYEGTDTFNVEIPCELGITGPVTVTRISAMCWQFQGMVGCVYLQLRICCVGGSLSATWYSPTFCPPSGSCIVTGTPITIVTLDCFNGALSPCPPCSNCLPDQPIAFACPDGSCSGSATVTPCIGGGNGLPGRLASQTGETTYGACATICGCLVCANWYYNQCQWYIDVYNNGTFCFTAPLTHTCCPLVLGTATGPVCGTCCGLTVPCSNFDCTYQYLTGIGWFLLDNQCAVGCGCAGAPIDPGFENEIRSIPCVTP